MVRDAIGRSFVRQTKEQGTFELVPISNQFPGFIAN